MNYAIFKSGGKQYKASIGDQIEVDRISLVSKDAIVTFPHVLLLVSDGKVVIGNPYIADTAVVGKVTGEKKGPKIKVSTFKAKARLRRTIGFRPVRTSVKIEKIETKKSPKK